MVGLIDKLEAGGDIEPCATLHEFYGILSPLKRRFELQLGSLWWLSSNDNYKQSKYNRVHAPLVLMYDFHVQFHWLA